MKNQQKLMIGIGLIVVVLVVAVLATSGKKNDNVPSSSTNSSSSQSTEPPAEDSAASTTSVDIKDYMFAPMTIKVKVGDTVTWTNRDGVRHNVVADKASADAPNGPLIGEGETYSFKFTKAGTYALHCDPHPYMHGTVIVE